MQLLSFCSLIHRGAISTDYCLIWFDCITLFKEKCDFWKATQGRTRSGHPCFCVVSHFNSVCQLERFESLRLSTEILSPSECRDERNNTSPPLTPCNLWFSLWAFDLVLASLIEDYFWAVFHKAAFAARPVHIMERRRAFCLFYVVILYELLLICCSLEQTEELWAFSPGLFVFACRGKQSYCCADSLVFIIFWYKAQTQSW